MKTFLDSLNRPALLLAPPAPPIHRFLPGLSPRRIMAIIAEEVCCLTGVAPWCLRRRLRKARIAQARQMCMWLASQASDLTDREIGRFLRRDHSTVHHGRRAIRDHMDVDANLHQQLTSLAITLQAKFRTLQILPLQTAQLTRN